MADEKDTAQEAPRGNKKQLIIFAVAGVLLFVGGGAATYLLFGNAAPPTGEGTAEAAEPEVEEGEPVYYKLDPTFVVTLPPGGPAGMLQVAIEVMTRTPTALETLKENDPMIRHHLLNLLEEQEARALLTVEGKKALQTGIHDFLNTTLAELDEPGKVKGVFFTQFVMQ